MADTKHPIVRQADRSATPTSLFAMGMASDAQELIRQGYHKEAIEVLNNLKILIDQRLAVKDEHGRHRFPDERE